jgi:hypothetical protein
MDLSVLAVGLRGKTATLPIGLAMAEVVHGASQEFWRPPVVHEGAPEIAISAVLPTMAETCSRCSTEFMIGARFCHACGAHRPEKNKGLQDVLPRPEAREFLSQKVAWLQSVAADLSHGGIALPVWLRYLHFHEIKRWIGLPTPSLVAFIIGLGCVVGALAVSLFYKASNMGEFQAIQMWRVEWLLGATASFVAGILLKKPRDDND